MVISNRENKVVKFIVPLKELNNLVHVQIKQVISILETNFNFTAQTQLSNFITKFAFWPVRQI